MTACSHYFRQWATQTLKPLVFEDVLAAISQLKQW